MPAIAIGPARSDADYAAGRMLFEEYAATLPFDLCFQKFGSEIENLAGIYGSPSGCLLLARIDDVNYDNPLPGVRYLAFDLSLPEPRSAAGSRLPG